MLVESKCALTMALGRLLLQIGTRQSALHGFRQMSNFSKKAQIERLSSVQFRKKDCTVTVVGLAKKTPLWTGESPTASAAIRHPDQLREILTRVPPWAGVGGE
jgi:hypothetical protein